MKGQVSILKNKKVKVGGSATYDPPCTSDSRIIRNIETTIRSQEMIQTAHQMFPRYFQPISDGTLAPSDTIKLFQRVQGDLVEVAGKLSRVPGFRTTLELPYTSRVLLIAAFLASHNPARLDKRFFCKGKSSRRKVKTRKGGAKEGMKGPKSFPLERMVAIYSSITQVQLSLISRQINHVVIELETN